MILLQVEMQGFEEIERELGLMKDKSKMVLRTAINNSAKQIEGKMARGAKQKYIYKGNTVSEFRAANKLKKATTRKPTAYIIARGSVNELLDFRVNPPAYFPGGKGAPKSIKARARKDQKFKEIILKPGSQGDQYKGFVVRYKTGHMAVAQRVPGKRMKSNPRKEALKSLLSLSKPKMEEMAYKDYVDKDAQGILMENIQKQIARYLG